VNEEMSFGYVIFSAACFVLPVLAVGALLAMAFSKAIEMALGM
jgi:hypothetical protein